MLWWKLTFQNVESSSQDQVKNVISYNFNFQVPLFIAFLQSDHWPQIYNV